MHIRNRRDVQVTFEFDACSTKRFGGHDLASYSRFASANSFSVDFSILDERFVWIVVEWAQEVVVLRHVKSGLPFCTSSLSHYYDALTKVIHRKILFRFLEVPAPNFF